MWDMVRVDGREIQTINSYLKEGYEPFAVSTNSYDYVTVWMKREVNEIHSEQKSVKGTSRRATAKAEG